MVIFGVYFPVSLMDEEADEYSMPDIQHLECEEGSSYALPELCGSIPHW